MNMQNVFWMSLAAPMILAAVVAGIGTGWVVRNGKKWGIIDDPKTHKHAKVVHTHPVPRGGGLPIFSAIFLGVALFLPNNFGAWGIVAGGLILAITGWLDDRYPERVSPYLRLALNTLAALCVIGAGIGIAYITNPLGGVLRLDGWQYCLAVWGGNQCIWVWSDLFALVWLVGMQNIVGWSSGVDGQLPGFVIIAALTMGLLGLRFGTDPAQLPVITLAGITAGAYLGFLPWNWWPQKIMPGYGGKSLAGFLLGTLAILSAAKVGALILVLGIQFVDAFLVVIKRVREGRSPVWGGREHLHHYLLDLGWSKRKIAGFYWMVSGVLAFFAIQLNSTSKYFTMATVTLVLGGIILWLQNWSTWSKRPDPDNG